MCLRGKVQLDGSGGPHLSTGHCIYFKYTVVAVTCANFRARDCH